MRTVSPVGAVGAEVDRVVLRTVLTVPPHPLDGLHAADVTLNKTNNIFRTVEYLMLI